MKKLFLGVICLGVLSFSLSAIDAHAEESSNGVNFISTEQSYPEEAKKAGYTYEQYKDIVAIPNLPSENIIEDNSHIQSRATSPSDQQKVVNEAKKYLGVPYLWGGTTPAGFDCSGLVQYVFKNAVGINLPRVTTQQENAGKEISLNSLSPGDLLFFGDRGATYHVAIYIGNNQYIHAPQPGETVKVASISSYFMPSFARRVLNDNYTPEPKPVPVYDSVISGDWNGDGKDSVGMKRNNIFYLRNSLTSGKPETTFAFGKPEDEVIVGDWNGDGKDSIGIRRGNIFYLRNNLSSGEPDYVFAYGKPEDEVIVGDWNGDGKDSIGLKRDNVFYLRNNLTSGEPDYVFAFGKPTDQAIVGDWNGDGKDSIGLKRENIFYLRNALDTGNVDYEFAYGRPTDQAIVGDWNGNGKDTIGLKRGNTIYARNSLDNGDTDITFNLQF